MNIFHKIEFTRPRPIVFGPSMPGRSVGSGPNNAPQGDTERQALRKEFPFLGASDCPLELKALVTDRISSYHRYQDAWPKLFTAATPEECAAVASTLVKAYVENRRTWEELNYYQEHHRVLGHHPIFRQFSNVRKLRTMSLRDLLRREKQVRMNIWRVESELKKNTKPHLDQARRDKLRGYQAELAEIRRLLDEE